MFECGSSPLKLKYIEQSTVLCPTCLLAAHWQPVQLWDRCQESIRTQAGILPSTSSQLGVGWVGGINWGSRNALENVRNMCFLKQTNTKKTYIFIFFTTYFIFIFEHQSCDSPVWLLRFGNNKAGQGSEVSLPEMSVILSTGYNPRFFFWRARLIYSFIFDLSWSFQCIVSKNSCKRQITHFNLAYCHIFNEQNRSRKKKNVY